MVGTNCKWCGTDGDVWADTGYCEDCDADIIHCCICDEEQYYESSCRHVFQTQDDFEWAGSGTGHAAEALKGPLFRLLNLMPPMFAIDLHAAIKANKFHTVTLGPMIGGGATIELYGMPVERRRDYSDALAGIGEGDNAEETADGWRWLVSLYDGDTVAANHVTADWIAYEWRSSQP